MSQASARASLQPKSARPRTAIQRGEPAPAFDRCEVFTALEPARAAWRELAALDCGTPYQSFEFAEAWLATIGAAPDALLPLGLERLGPFHVARFLGGKDSNFNLALFRPGARFDADALRRLLAAASRAAPRSFIGFAFSAQPYAWRGNDNPFAALAHQPTPSSAYRTDLRGDYGVWINAHYSRAAHKKLRRKSERLSGIGGLRHRIAESPAEAETMLGVYARLKELRMRELGLSRQWDRALSLAFLTRLIEGQDPPPLEIHALYAGERPVAVFGGLAQRDRLCGAFIAYDSDPIIARNSPGELLLNEIIRNLISRNFAAFDLGVGEARYKSHCCEIEQPLFDTFVAQSAAGHVLRPFALGALRAKGFLKRTPPLWNALTRLRRRIG